MSKVDVMIDADPPQDEIVLEERSILPIADQMMAVLNMLFRDALSENQPGWRVSAVPYREGAGGSFVLASGLHVAITAVDGTPIILTSHQVPEAAALLDRADALCAELEVRLGTAFEPQALVDAIPPGTLQIAISRGLADTETRIDFAFPQDVASALYKDLQRHAQSLPAVRASTPISCAMMLMGPPLDIDAAAELAVGDMILLPDHMPCRIIPMQMGAATGPDAVPDITNFLGEIDGSYSLSSGQFQAGSVTQDEGAGGFAIRPAFFIDRILVPFSQLIAAQSSEPLITASSLFPEKIDVMLGDQVMAHGKFILGQGSAAFLITAMVANNSAEPTQFSDPQSEEILSEMQAD